MVSNGLNSIRLQSVPVTSYSCKTDAFAISDMFRSTYLCYLIFATFSQTNLYLFLENDLIIRR